MFTDHYIKQRAALSHDSRVRNTKHSKSQETKNFKDGQALSCKSKINLSRQQLVPSQLRTQGNGSSISHNSSHNMPSVIRSTRPPIVYSPSSSPAADRSRRTSRARPANGGLPVVLYRDKHNTRGKALSQQWGSNGQRLCGQPTAGAMDGMSRRSSYSYVYNSQPVAKRASVSSVGSSGGHREPWRKMAHTICMGEGVMLEDDVDSSCSASGLGSSVGDSVSYQESYGHNYTEADLEDDLTDLEDTDDDSIDTTDSLTLTQKDQDTIKSDNVIKLGKDKHTTEDGEAMGDVDILSSKIQKELRVSEDGLAAEVIRRRERDFGKDSFHKDTIKQTFKTSLSLRHSQPTLALPRPAVTAAKSESMVVETGSQVTPPVVTDRGDVGRHSQCPPLRPSLFPQHMAPTIHFPMEDEPYSPLTKEQRALLKWKMSTITPNVVRSCVARVGFSKCSRGNSWLGYWGKHMKAEGFRLIRDYQKVNHFPGTFEIGRKDRLWRNLYRLQARVGRRELNFVPQTYVLPQDMRQLRKEFEEKGSKQKWILKPPAAARGIGIRVVSRWSQIPKKRPVVVQRYLADPYLINGSKFDLRVYVYVSCYDPLRIYVFKEGLARFATCKYSSAMKHLSNRFMHLTNYSINKRNSAFTPNTDETVCQGHKWGLLALWRYMEAELAVDTAAVWRSITDLVIKTIICSEPSVVSNIKANVKNPYSVHELFGFDVMLDRHLKPWILEVNISPSLHSQSQLDVNIKGRLVRDLFNITGFTLPTREQLAGEQPSSKYSLTTDERIKHSMFVHKSLTEVDRRRILDTLTTDDLTMLMKAEDELARCGDFERVFPCASYDSYRKYFEIERYYNILLCEWTSRYSKAPQKGLALLQRESKLLSKTKKAN